MNATATPRKLDLDTAAVRIPRDLRIEIVGQMSEAGMSTRAIGAAVGAAQDTVRRDLAEGARNRSPEIDAAADETSMTDAELAGLAELIDREAHEDDEAHEEDEPNLT